MVGRPPPWAEGTSRFTLGDGRIALRESAAARAGPSCAVCASGGLSSSCPGASFHRGATWNQPGASPRPLGALGGSQSGANVHGRQAMPGDGS
jgi:hypothetical protein